MTWTTLNPVSATWRGVTTPQTWHDRVFAVPLVGDFPPGWAVVVPAAGQWAQS